MLADSSENEVPVPLPVWKRPIPLSLELHGDWLAVKSTPGIDLNNPYTVMRVSNSLGLFRFEHWVFHHVKEYCAGIHNGFVVEEIG